MNAEEPGVGHFLVALRENLGSVPAGDAGGEGETYAISLDAGASYLARSARGAPSLLVPLAEAVSLPGISTTSLLLTSNPKVIFDVRGRRWESPAAVLCCRRPELLETFAVLAFDLNSSLSRLGRPLHWQDIGRALQRWQQLLSTAHPLTPDQELGLWGELLMIASAANPGAAISAWLGPMDAPIDFVRNGIGLECKTSRHRLRHHVSQAQVNLPLGDYLVYFVSLWVVDDPVRGVTVPELVSRIEAERVDPVAFEAKLLEAGYCRADAASYGQRLSLTEDPVWFASDAVPRVRQADQGVSQLRYCVDLADVRRLGGGSVDGVKAAIWAANAGVQAQRASV